MSFDALALARQLISCNTVNANEESATALIAPHLRGAGFTVELVEQAPGRTSLIAEWGIESGEPPLCLAGHLDTVPPSAEQWSSDPFAPELSEGRLYGLGASDMKSGVAAIVASSIEVARVHARSRRERSPATPGVRILLTSGEETGCLGARACLPTLSTRLPGPVIVAEPTGNRVFNGHKGALWVKLRSLGLAGHGSIPNDEHNALMKLLRVLHSLAEHPPTRRRHPTLGASTINLSTIHGGDSINAVPDAAHATLDLRTVPGQSHRELFTEIARIAGEDAEVEILLDLEPVWTAADGPCARSLALAMRRANRTDRESNPGGEGAAYIADTAVLRELWPDQEMFICGPGEPAAMHTTDEWCSVSRLHEATHIYSELIRDWNRL